MYAVGRGKRQRQRSAHTLLDFFSPPHFFGFLQLVSLTQAHQNQTMQERERERERRDRNAPWLVGPADVCWSVVGSALGLAAGVVGASALVGAVAPPLADMAYWGEGGWIKGGGEGGSRAAGWPEEERVEGDGG